MITEVQIEAALDWLIANARPAAQARANRCHLEEFRKAKKAILMGQSDAKTISEREAYAYSHQEYLELLEGYKTAVEEDERFRWLLTAAENKIEIFRTLQANARAQCKVV